MRAALTGRLHPAFPPGCHFFSARNRKANGFARATGPFSPPDLARLVGRITLWGCFLCLCAQCRHFKTARYDDLSSQAARSLAAARRYDAGGQMHAERGIVLLRAPGVELCANRALNTERSQRFHWLRRPP
jgi:hypothetical protein